jgi:phage terminase large subunit-like protein
MGSFNRPTKEMERMMLSEQIKIEKNPVLLWNFRNVTLKHDPINDNVKPIKTNQDSKIDGVI